MEETNVNRTLTTQKKSVMVTVCTSCYGKTQKWHIIKPRGIRDHFSEEAIAKVNPKDHVEMQRSWAMSRTFP